ncbi:MAG: DUF5674 family protein [bacterium]|nr:DUF5674 family protein [bacterium]
MSELSNIKIIRQRATSSEIVAMLKVLGDYIKLAVDVERELVAGGGELHADCETALLNDGSLQENIWGADWHPKTKEVFFESLINIRPRQNNRSMLIQDPELRNRVDKIVRSLLEVD